MIGDFVYSTGMQIIHIANSFITNTLVMYLISELLLMLLGEKASIRQKFIFSFITGTLLQTAFVYVIYLISLSLGRNSFSPLLYILLTTPNPLFAVIYCVTGEKVLKLSFIRSIKAMGYLYLFYLLSISLTNSLAPIFFQQPSDKYNFLLAMSKQTTFFLTVLVAYFILKRLIKTRRSLIRFADKVFIDVKKEMFLFIMKVTFFYILLAMVPSFMHDNLVLAHLLILLILSLFLALSIYFDVNNVRKADIENKAIYMNALSKGVDEFRSIKHDFYNILQTYSGYLQLGNLDGLREYHSSLLTLAVDAGKVTELNDRMIENPALVSLLIKKADYAEEMNVKMTMTLACSVDNLYIDNLDICRCIACLLDNAIEAAAESNDKKVFFTIEQKTNGSKLIIITNSTLSDVDVNKISEKNFTTKSNHTGLGVSNILKILDLYGNCSFKMKYSNYEFQAYIELYNTHDTEKKVSGSQKR